MLYRQLVIFHQCRELEIFYNHVNNVFTVNVGSRLGPCKLRSTSSALAVIASFAKQLTPGCRLWHLLLYRTSSKSGIESIGALVDYRIVYYTGHT